MLYVEDEEADRLFMQMAFQEAGIEPFLRTVPDGKAAIDYLSGTGRYADRAQNPFPALVLLDLNLPQLPGFEVLQWVRMNPTFGTLPVIIFTSSTREADKAQAKALGASEYIEKPFIIAKWVQIAFRLKQTWGLGAKHDQLMTQVGGQDSSKTIQNPL